MSLNRNFGRHRANRASMKLQLGLCILLIVQFIVVVFHDMVDIPGLIHGKQVRATIGRGKFWIATGVNAIFPGIAVGLALVFFNRPASTAAQDYWVVYCGISLLSAIAMWYVPYLVGCDEQRRSEYERMYAGTIHILPRRGNNPRPNLFHMLIHALFISTLALTLVMRFGSAR